MTDILGSISLTSKILNSYCVHYTVQSCYYEIIINYEALIIIFVEFMQIKTKQNTFFPLLVASKCLIPRIQELKDQCIL